MNEAQWGALRSAATAGVSFDGLVLEQTGEGFVLETPAERYEPDGEAALREMLAGDEDAASFVSNWYYWTQVLDVAADRYAYLRWLEHADERDVPTRYEKLADGVTREWGQLLVTVQLGEAGQRRYNLRHVADRDADPTALDERTDPRDARDLSTYDDGGRYRPLKTAPSLAPGWRFADLDGPDLVRAVDFFYPATVSNWHREREGELDVSHWRPTAERQTGIYEIVEGLPDAAVGWAAEACCVDSQCLKRREWDLDEDTELDVARGEGEFPCREPCSLLIAAAREWTELEREETRTYELELTPSEREQIAEIVDAVADGRVDEIREADVGDGANRYRARYLRAKRGAELDANNGEE